MQDWNFKRGDIKGSGKAKRALKLRQGALDQSKIPTQAAPMDKKLGNKSVLFVFTEGRNISKPGTTFCSFRQLQGWGRDQT